MPEIVIPEGGAQIALRFQLSGDPEVMVTTVGAMLDVTDLTAVANRAQTSWNTAFPADKLNSSWTFLGAEARDGEGGIGVSTGVAVVGTEASQSLPQNCAVLVHKRTALAGRKGRGRMFIPSGYLFDAQVDNKGAISSGSLANLQTGMTSFLTTMNASAEINTLALFHTNSPGILFNAITALTVDSIIATQRRRLRH